MLNEITRGGGPKAVLVRIFGAIAIALALMLSAGSMARAQAPAACAAHAEIERQLERKFAERRIALALTEKGSLVEVYASPDGATWTVVVTLVDGRSCVLLAGQDWYDARPIALEPEA